VPAIRGNTPFTRALFALLLATLAALALACFQLSPAPAQAAQRPCSSYPTPGTLAPAGTKVPATLRSHYAILRRPQRAIDKIPASRLSGSLTAADVIMSGTRYLGKAAFGGRIYLVPAEHELSYPLAPERCIPASERSLEQELLPQLRAQYKHSALCIVVLETGSGSPTCAANTGQPDALLYTSGTPGYGLVPNGVSAVTVTYQTSSPRTVPVRHNFFSVVAPKQAAAPCGVQWLDPTGNVIKVVTGCSYLTAEAQQLYQYRSYVAANLSTLQTQLQTLVSAIASGNLSGAESAWLTAHLTWLEIGQDDGAYGCFGNLGGEIDGLAAGHPLGTADPGFTGFHKIEFDLWTNHDLTAAAADTTTLQNLLAKLMKTPLSSYLPATSNGIANWVLRPHEVLEDALRDSLTADDDYGSGTDLASITADVTAVREFLTVLGPILDPMAPRLASEAHSQLDSLMTAIDATQVNRTWVSIENLPTRQRQQIDADVGAVLETLAPVPDLLTSTGHNAPSD
jgi:iron uptake system EfeUOB component EfeO/EfeM